MASKRRLTVLTQNVWGGVPGWERRRALLVREIARHSPDVVGLQEVHARHPGAPSEQERATHFDPTSPSSFGLLPSQAHEIAAMLGGYNAYFAPGRRSPSGACEGVALLCKGNVHEHAVHALTLDSNDRFDGKNQRVVLCATIEMGSQRADVFVTHLSLSPRARWRTVFEVLAFAERERRRSGSVGAVLLGDFNAQAQERIIAEIERPPVSGSRWIDAWKAVHGPQARGGTWPALLPLRRIDYVFVQPPPHWSLERCERARFAGSDHLGVLAHLHVDAAHRDAG